MQYFITKTLYDLKRKKYMILFAAALFLCLELWFFYNKLTPEEMETSTIPVFSYSCIYYGCTSLSNGSLIYSLLKILKVIFPLYLFYYLINSDLANSVTNIFLRMNKRQWFIKKSLLLLFITLLVKIVTFILYIILYQELPEFIHVLGDLGMTLGTLGCAFLFACSNDDEKRIMRYISLALITMEVLMYFLLGFNYFYLSFILILISFLIQIGDLK